MATVTIKRGDDLEWTYNLTESLVPADITSWTIRAQMRKSDGTLQQELLVTKTTPTAGKFSITATDTETATWELITYNVDIEFTDHNGIVFSTATFQVTVVEDITLPVVP